MNGQTMYRVGIAAADEDIVLRVVRLDVATVDKGTVLCVIPLDVAIADDKTLLCESWFDDATADEGLVFCVVGSGFSVGVGSSLSGSPSFGLLSGGPPPGGSFSGSSLMIENLGGKPGGHNRRQTIPNGNENTLWQSEGKSGDE